MVDAFTLFTLLVCNSLLHFGLQELFFAFLDLTTRLSPDLFAGLCLLLLLDCLERALLDQTGLEHRELLHLFLLGQGFDLVSAFGKVL